MCFKVAREIHPQSLVAKFFNTEFGLFICPSQSHATFLFDILSPHLPHIHLPPAQTMDQSQFLYHWEESELDHPDESLFGFYPTLFYFKTILMIVSIDYRGASILFSLLFLLPNPHLGLCFGGNSIQL